MPVAPSESQPWKRWSLHHCVLRRVLRKVNTARAEWHKSTISTADYMRKSSLNWLLWAIGSDQFESMSTNLTMQQQAQAAGCSWLCHTLLAAWQWVQVSAQYILSPPPLGLRGNVPYPAVPPCAWDTTWNSERMEKLLTSGTVHLSSLALGMKKKAWSEA